MYVKTNIHLNQASTLPFRSVLLLCRNQSTDLWSKSMGWFLYIGNTGLKQANPNYHLFHILFSPFMKKPFFPSPNLTRNAFHKSIKPRMQTENLANISHKQFYGQLNNNQIKLYNYPDLTHDLTSKTLSLLLVVQASLNFSISTRNGKEEIPFLKNKYKVSPAYQAW